MKTKLGPGFWRRRVRALIFRDRLLLSSFSFPHANFYGKWRSKVPNILPDERIHRNREAIPWVWLSAVGRLLRDRRRSSNQRAQKGSDTYATRVSCLLPAVPDSARVACLPKARRWIAPLFDFGEECVETLASGVLSFGQPGLE